MKNRTLLFSSLLILAGCGAQEEATPKPVVDVKVAKAEVADIKITVRAPASVFAREQANIGARLTAPIRKLLVRKGDSVTAGQVLAQLDNRDLLAQRAEAEAAVTDAEANLQRVTSGTVPTDIERARGQSVGAEATLNQAQKFYDRRKQLFEQGAIPQRDLLVSETDLAQAKANFDEAGIGGLVPRKRGPRGPHKLRGEVLAFLERRVVPGQPIRARTLATIVRQEFDLDVHPRTIERALGGKKTPR